MVLLLGVVIMWRVVLFWFLHFLVDFALACFFFPVRGFQKRYDALAAVTFATVVLKREVHSTWRLKMLKREAR